MTNSPADLLGRIEAAATRIETPCGDGQMVWHLWGEGPPVVLLHGGSGSWRHWVRNIEPLAERYRLLVPDLPGFGESAVPPEPVDFTTISAAVCRGIERLLPDGAAFDVVGFSFGSHSAHYVAHAMGARVRTLVHVNGHAVGALEAIPNTILERWRDVTDPAERREIFRRNLTTLMLADPENADALAMAIYETDVPRARIRPPKFINQRDMTLVEKIRCRLVHISGEHDPLGTPSVRAQQARLLEVRPNAEVHLIEGAGHWVAYEAADRFNRLIFEVLGRGAGPAGR